jgi:hypothetical protein
VTETFENSPRSKVPNDVSSLVVSSMSAASCVRSHVSRPSELPLASPTEDTRVVKPDSFNLRWEPTTRKGRKL